MADDPITSGSSTSRASIKSSSASNNSTMEACSHRLHTQLWILLEVSTVNTVSSMGLSMPIYHLLVLTFTINNTFINLHPHHYCPLLLLPLLLFSFQTNPHIIVTPKLPCLPCQVSGIVVVPTSLPHLIRLILITFLPLLRLQPRLLLSKGRLPHPQYQPTVNSSHK